jgi:16S rRNA (cytosine967-C5)-methyltransferase
LKLITRSRKSAISPARVAAFDILLRIERDQAYASELLHSSPHEHLSNADHALATELVMGVLRWRSRLDDEIARVSSQALSKLDVEVLIALRLAVFQFRWLTRVPHHAAVDESVDLVKRVRKASAASFVNAVLRKLSTAPHETLAINENPSASDIARAFAHPAWMVQRWVRDYGISAAKQICEYDQSIPATSVRLRVTKLESDLASVETPDSTHATRGGRNSRDRSEDVILAPGRLLASARRVAVGDITKTPAFRKASVVIQDEASQLVAALVGGSAAKNEQRILDCCAAPGGKTLAIADREPSAVITAVDVHPHRARLMMKLVRAAAADGRIRVVVADARDLPSASQFDAVLADVPCSGTGTLARNPEIKWRLSAADLVDLQSRQIAILRGALDRVARGGRLVYSTCSLEREENEEVIEHVSTENNSCRVLDCRLELDRLKARGELIWPEPGNLMRAPFLRTIPGVHPCDGFFAAILEKV